MGNQASYCCFSSRQALKSPENQNLNKPSNEALKILKTAKITENQKISKSNQSSPRKKPKKQKLNDSSNWEEKPILASKSEIIEKTKLKDRKEIFHDSNKDIKGPYHSPQFSINDKSFSKKFPKTIGNASPIANLASKSLIVIPEEKNESESMHDTLHEQKSAVSINESNIQGLPTQQISNNSIIFSKEDALRDKKSENLILVEAPKYQIDDVLQLDQKLQREISWLFLQFKTKDEVLEEEVDGYLPIKKENRYGIKQKRWLLFSTEALYIVTPNNFKSLRRRILLSTIDKIYQQSGNQSFALHIKEEEGSECLRILTPRTLDAINAIKTLYYLKTEEFLEIKLVNSEKEMLEITKKEDSEGQEMKNNLIFGKIKAVHGIPGEQMVNLRKVYEVIKPGSKQMIILITASKTIYIANPKGILYNYVTLSQIKEIHTLANLSEFLLKTDEGDIWIQDNETPFIVREISDVIEHEMGYGILVKQIEHDEIAFKRIPKISKGKQRPDLEIIEGSESGVRGRDRRGGGAMIDYTDLFNF
ncbi:unnamed protein product [Blepharisma stoltei]|uniref:Uncharacterized protein n=1 Tax=Blepharisma stoltei TaxID=1481888 RepID=A0AAU9JRL2_9CILI|nr:unnamed protein product [Blepharisma stoltei]